ncbi:hypothetical protein [Gimesia chilikensis]|uniref:Uncharacterized protein n=1 Tax=Gimesia chilikensis TaxID=2605989 RepID=A0A517PVW7_9PLAN|nr:hypothetical protein [Gimesia chilikensis]QDT23516.1 hypothetical protein HG66A1_53370 [Gimesia chilikensis]
MSEDFIKLTRQQLYERVWTEPMSKLAPQFGLSDVGLKKICRKHQIPTPPIGHWAKIEFGKSSPQPELSQIDEEDLQEIRLFRRQFDKPATSSVPAPDIKVNEKLVRPHKLVDLSRQRLRNAEPGYRDRGLQPVHGEECLGITVSKKSLTRALRLLDALIKYWESTGGTVSAGKPGTRFSRGEDIVELCLTEQTRRHEIPNRYSCSYQYEATGKLTFNIDSWGDGLRRTWSDGKKQRLEDVLGKVALQLDVWLDDFRVRRLDRECEERQEKQAAVVRQSRKEFSKKEKERRENLDSCVDRWSKSQRIKTYLTTLDDAVESGRIEYDDEQFHKWREWAQWYAIELCPLTPNLPAPSIHHVPPPQNTPIQELDLTSDARSCFEQARIMDTDELDSLTKEELRDRCGKDIWSLYREATRILEGLGYDVSDRKNGYF